MVNSMTRTSIKIHLEKLYKAKPSTSVKIKAIQESNILYWENKLKLYEL